MVVVRSRTTVVSMPCGIEALIDGSCGADAIVGRDDVRAGLAEDDEHDRAFAVEIAAGADVLRGVDDVGDIGEADGGSVADSR